MWWVTAHTPAPIGELQPDDQLRSSNKFNNWGSLAVLMAQPAPPPAPQASPPQPYYPPPPQASAPSPPPTPPMKSRTLLYAVIAVVVIAVVAAAGLAASGAFSPKNPPSRLPATSLPATKNLINTQSQTFGPNTNGAVVVGFDVPTLGGSWVNGTFAITGCTSIGNYCLANAWLFTPSAWSNYVSGGTATGICLTLYTTSCQSEQNAQIASGDLSSYAGQTLDLCLWSNATTESQTFSADVNFNFFSGSST